MAKKKKLKTVFLAYEGGQALGELYPEIDWSSVNKKAVYDGKKISLKDIYLKDEKGHTE